ncbi:MAG: exodeoxyribonuclease VII large subunit [Bacteroidales bacterium]
MENKTLSLKELQNIVKQTIEAIPQTFWVVAEISELRESSKGHCYIELVHKSECAEYVEAKASANIWANVYRMLKPYFELSTKMTLMPGMKVLFNVAVTFHELYGLRLNVLDMDPTYTVGEVTLLRQQNIERLKCEGVFAMNRELRVPDLPKRIAIISSENAAGYGDFLQQLHNSVYAFSTTLFSATMQGREAEQSILRVLAEIAEQYTQFDVVAIIRGGGAQSDLTCFDSYILANNIAQFPLPIITGIGHDRDVSVVDKVANTMLKTPTATADFLIEKMNVQSDFLTQLSENMAVFWLQNMERVNHRLQTYTIQISALSKQHLSHQWQYLDLFSAQLHQVSQYIFFRKHFIVRQLEEKLQLLNPYNVLQRGYSITYKNGELIKNVKQVSEGDILHTKFSEGSAILKVK